MHPNLDSYMAITSLTIARGYGGLVVAYVRGLLPATPGQIRQTARYAASNARAALAALDRAIATN